MERTRTGYSKIRSLTDYVLDKSRQTAASIGVCYLPSEGLDAHLARNKEKVLGVVAFGAPTPTLPSFGVPVARVDMPLLHDDATFEVWTSNTPVKRDEEEGLTASSNDEFLFGCLEIDEGVGLEAAAFLAYCQIFDFIDRRGYQHLLRVWNYFPQITEISDGLERYQSFSVGRHNAFDEKGRKIGSTNIPAACALGSQSGSLVVYFLAAKRAGQPIENPRQTSAYNYPAQYGPRSPTFSRAMLSRNPQQSLLLISGTASIVGHATLHIGNTLAQARETFANINSVITQAALHGWTPSKNGADLLLKVYLRYLEDLSIVKDHLRMAFGPDMQAIYLQADICRPDLQLEVEGVAISADVASN
ncbi:MAG TPA: hypothetical protein VM532_05840 [Burkholderiales bacterium]|nr:hypothetical protein [Burkholderiales bacterium]